MMGIIGWILLPVVGGIIAIVTGLDYRDPMFDPHIAFQHAKQHPLIEPILRGGQLVRYSLVPPGDGMSVPNELAADSPLGGALLGHRAGDQVIVKAPAGERLVEIVDVR